MNEDKNHLRYDVEFLEDNESSGDSSPYIAYTFHVKLTDALIMFHVCHLYRNCLILIENGELTEEEIPNYITLGYVIRSVQEALDNRVKELSSEYINDNYKYIYDRPKLFDICLDYYAKIKKELTEKTEAIIKEHKSKKEEKQNKIENE